MVRPSTRPRLAEKTDAQSRLQVGAPSKTSFSVSEFFTRVQRLLLRKASIPVRLVGEHGAVRYVKASGYRLRVAKLDRRSRNRPFVTALQDSKVDFVAADNPHATSFFIHILVAAAEPGRNRISNRTKSALDAARARGVKFGNPRYEEAIPKVNEAQDF